MEPFALDADTAERLVAGAVDAGDAPPEYRDVARVLHALRSVPDSAQRSGEPAAVERIVAAVVVPRRARRPPRVRRKARFSSRIAGLAAAAGVAAVVCVTGGFASAGSLPEPAQNAASTVLGTVGISVPTGEEPASTPATPTPDAANAGAPTPTTAAPAAPSSPATPGNGKGTPAHGAPASTGKGHGNGNSRNGSPPGVGNGKSP